MTRILIKPVIPSPFRIGGQSKNPTQAQRGSGTQINPAVIPETTEKPVTQPATQPTTQPTTQPAQTEQPATQRGSGG